MAALGRGGLEDLLLEAPPHYPLAGGPKVVLNQHEGLDKDASEKSHKKRIFRSMEIMTKRMIFLQTTYLMKCR